MGHVRDPRVCVIGAGVAGLSLARYLSKEGIKFTVLEATKYIGGTWRYDPRTGNDENGLPIHTSMYDEVRTNLPKAPMSLPGFPLPDHYPSYPSWDLYYDYLKSIAKKLELERYIKFLHKVVSVKRLTNIWTVEYKNIVTGEVYVEKYDYVIIGSGHHSKPYWPTIEGQNLFKGKIIHSHDYRGSNNYKNRRVLLIGAGPSGLEISLLIAEKAKLLVHSHHSTMKTNTPFPSTYLKKPDVRELTENGAIFIDGTFEEVDDVIYCTGYEYYYPFLDESCGLTVTSHSVTPLYKYLVNANQPTMLVLGNIVRACVVIAIDAQARYATALIKGDFTLPPKDVMMAEWTVRADELKAKSLPSYYIHILDDKEDAYYESLAKESGIERVPPVLPKIRRADVALKAANLYTYRDYAYTVHDNETFTNQLIQ